MSSYKVGIVGVTGAVGQEFLRLLSDRNFPVQELRLFASERSKGKEINWKGERLKIDTPSFEGFKGLDFVFFSAGTRISLEYAEIAVKAGAIVIDNSAAFRMDPDVPLIVPEINGNSINLSKGIISNPNCATIQLVMVLYPLHIKAGLKRVVVSTYQSVSGAGRRAIEELKRESRKVLDGLSPQNEVFPHPIAFEVLPHIDQFQDYGYTREEWKIIKETRKILNLPELKITATAVRVPVFRGHSESVNVEFNSDLCPEDAKSILSQFKGIKVMDEPQNCIYPLVRLAEGKYEVFVGRIRKDLSVEYGLNLWIVSDNLLKGAALNGIQIAEKIIY